MVINDACAFPVMTRQISPVNGLILLKVFPADFPTDNINRLITCT